MICARYVKSILESTKSWGSHHKPSADLPVSDTDVCAFCSRIRMDAMNRENPKLVQHRWSVRKLGRTRDTQNAIAITFRADESTCGDDTVTSTNVQSLLPERTFYLFHESGPQLKSWMRECATQHEDCRIPHEDIKNSERFVPIRLLAVQPLAASGTTAEKRILLVDTKQHMVKGPYMTLSHCWGRGRCAPLKTSRAEKNEFSSLGIPWNRLSETFKDAIETTYYLGISYLWIDSLCIVQDDREERIKQVAEMHRIYRNSHCNLVAAHAKDGSGGLYHSRNESEIVPSVCKGTHTTSAILGDIPWRVFPENLWDTELLGSHIYTRGWVFQERMLSPRIIHFAANQVFFDCATLSACETLPRGLSLPLDTTASADRQWRRRLQTTTWSTSEPSVGKADGSLDSFWANAVRRYTACELSKVEDKIRALKGVATLVGDALKENIREGRDFYGLWEGMLVEQLAWKVKDGKRPNLWTCPSWSWAFVNGIVEVGDRRDIRWRCRVVHNHEGEMITVNEENRIAIQAHVVRAHVKWHGTQHKWVLDMSNNRETAESRTSDRGILEVFPQESREKTDGATFECHFVILASTAHTNGHVIDRQNWSPREHEHDSNTPYSGIGLTMDPADSTGCFFRRTGSISFRDVDSGMWESLHLNSGVALKEDEMDKGLKFWLV